MTTGNSTGKLSGLGELGNLNSGGRVLGQEPPPAETVSVEEMSDEQFRAAAEARGLEVSSARRPRRKVDRSESVKGKRRTTVYLPTALMYALKRASDDFERSVAMIVEEAVIDWFVKHERRLPPFETTWDKE